MLVSLLAAAALAPNMHLVCEGSTLTNLPTSQTTVAVRDNRGRSAVGEAETREPADVGFMAQLRIENGKARMNLPAYAAPAVNANKGGWYRVKKLTVDDHRITGKVVFNFLSSSTFEIDRRTGAITSSGGFQGMCHAVDTEARAF